MTFKVSDFFLLVGLYVNLSKRGFVVYIPHWLRLFFYLGAVWGCVSLIGTTLQSIASNLQFEIVFISHFFRYFRISLIFFWIYISFDLNYKGELKKLLNLFSLVGFVYILTNLLMIFSTSFSSAVEIFYDFELGDFDLFQQEKFRWIGLLGNPNSTGILASLFAVFSLFRLKTDDISFARKLLDFFIFIGAIYILLLSGSRTALISLLIFVSLYGYHYLSRKAAFVIIALSLLFLFFAEKSFSLKDLGLNERIVNLLEGEDTRGEASGLYEIMGRSNLWADRMKTFKEKGHSLAIFFGLGFTKYFKDYADNGLYSAFLNTGLIGLFFHLIIYYRSFLYFFGQFRSRLCTTFDIRPIVYSAMVLLIWDFTADSLVHIKIGQLFFLFLAIIATMSYKHEDSYKS